MTTEAPRAPLRNRTVGDIAATLPGATAVFRKFKLDFCCGGDVPLAEAARERGVDVASVEEALAALDTSAPVMAPETTAALIEHIRTRYHETHRRELPELTSLARKVEAVHAGHPQAPRGLAETLEELLSALEEHMQREEKEFFLLMRSDGASTTRHPTAQMRHDHDEHGEHLRRLEAITGGFVLPEGACRSWQALYAGTAKFADDLMEHIHLENNVLFPRFERGRSA